MSVCGIRLIATAAACKAKKEELSIAVGISLAFTVVMMFTLPAVCNAFGLDQVLAGAWIGGTVDSTGAVVAAGELVGPVARDVAAHSKRDDWVYFIRCCYTCRPGSRRRQSGRSTTLGLLQEIWNRLPKFIIGFVAVTIFTLASTGTAARQEGYYYDALWSGQDDAIMVFLFGVCPVGLETDMLKMASVSWVQKTACCSTCVAKLLISF